MNTITYRILHRFSLQRRDFRLTRPLKGHGTEHMLRPSIYVKLHTARHVDTLEITVHITAPRLHVKDKSLQSNRTWNRSSHHTSRNTVTKCVAKQGPWTKQTHKSAPY